MYPHRHKRSLICYVYFSQSPLTHVIQRKPSQADQKTLCVHGNCRCVSPVYSYQHRCHNNYCACLVNHFEDRAAVM